MSQDILIKVYGHVWPVKNNLAPILEPCFIFGQNLSKSEMLVFENDMLRLSFEGIYFDIDELISLLKPSLTEQCQGKVDYIDLEAWSLTRYIIQGTKIITSMVSLNAVMDYSGF